MTYRIMLVTYRLGISIIGGWASAFCGWSPDPTGRSSGSSAQQAVGHRDHHIELMLVTYRMLMTYRAVGHQHLAVGHQHLCAVGHWGVWLVTGIMVFRAGIFSWKLDFPMFSVVDVEKAALRAGVNDNFFRSSEKCCGMRSL